MSELKFRPPKKLLVVPWLVETRRPGEKDPFLKAARAGDPLKAGAQKKKQVSHPSALRAYHLKMTAKSDC
jgi:hypothetical protein